MNHNITDTNISFGIAMTQFLNWKHPYWFNGKSFSNIPQWRHPMQDKDDWKITTIKMCIQGNNAKILEVKVAKHQKQHVKYMHQYKSHARWYVPKLFTLFNSTNEIFKYLKISKLGGEHKGTESRYLQWNFLCGTDSASRKLPHAMNQFGILNFNYFSFQLCLDTSYRWICFWIDLQAKLLCSTSYMCT